MTSRETMIRKLSQMLPRMDWVTCHARFVGGPCDGGECEDFPWCWDYGDHEHVETLVGDDDVEEHYLIVPVPSDGRPAVKLVYMGGTT